MDLEMITITSKEEHLGDMEDFPDEILIRIMTFLNQSDLLAAALVNKKMNRLARDPTLWKKVELFPSSSLRSMQHFLWLIRLFPHVNTLKVTLGRQGDQEFNFQDDNNQLKQAVTNLLIQRPSVSSFELDFHNLGIMFPRTVCLPLYQIFDQHAYGITNVKITEVSQDSYVKWYDWTEEFIDVAPRFWVHVKELKLNDIGLLSFPANNGALSNIVKNCGQLEKLLIHSRSVLKLVDLQNMLQDMEDSKLKVFRYSSEQEIRHWNDSKSEWNNLKSKSYHISIAEDEEKRVKLISVTSL